MLPSRGLTRSNPASALRSCLPGQAKAARPLQTPIRNFSGLTSTPNLSRTGRNASPLIRLSSAVPPASVVFASRMGASRNLSFWGFGTKPQPAPTSTPEVAPEAVTPVPPVEPIAAAAPAPVDPTPVAAPVEAVPSFDNLDLVSILDIPEQIGYLKNLGLDFGWGPTAMCEWFLEHIYVYSGMPWWAAIGSAALAFRLAIMYPTFLSSRHGALLAKAHKTPEYLAAQEAAKASARTQDTQAMLAARNQMKSITRAHGVKFKWLAVPFLTVPFSYGMFRLMRAMAAIPVPSLEMGGLLWFTDLTVHDPLYILPILNAGLGVMMFKQGQKSNPNPTPMMQQASGLFTYILPPVVFLSTAWLPAAVQWFFLSLTSTSVLQTTATLNPAVRNYFGLPPLPQKLGPVTSAGAAKANWQAPAARKKFTQDISTGVEGMKSSWNNMTGGDAESVAWKKAEEYEKRRAAEEIQKTNRRMEDQRRKRAERSRR